MGIVAVDRVPGDRACYVGFLIFCDLQLYHGSLSVAGAVTVAVCRVRIVLNSGGALLVT